MPPSYHQKMLPNQTFNSNLYEGNEEIMSALYGLLQDHTGTVKNTFKLNTHARVGFEEMSTPPIQLSLIKFLIDMTKTKTFLEIGTFIGNSTMHIANFIGADADVVTIEKFDEFADLARKNFEDNHFLDCITLHSGDAYQVMQKLPDNYFDFIYVDGDKGRYLDLTKLAEKKLSKHGLILVDDVFFHGDVLNPTAKTDKGKGCKELLEYYKDTKDFSKYILPINNGILLLKR
jgi:predicted O-methyltransferase YrrM